MLTVVFQESKKGFEEVAAFLSRRGVNTILSIIKQRFNASFWAKLFVKP